MAHASAWPFRGAQSVFPRPPVCLMRLKEDTLFSNAEINCVTSEFRPHRPSSNHV